MLTQKRATNSNSSHYRLSAAKPFTSQKVVSNRSISIPHSILTHKKDQPSSSQNNMNASISSNQQKFYLGKGNNEDIVRRVLSTRNVWVQKQDSTNTFINFKWQQDQKGFHYNRLLDSAMYRCVLNQLEFHQCLSNKQYLFKNIQTYCLKNGINLWDIVPPTFILNAKDQVNMQNLDRLFDYYEKYLPKSIKNTNNDYQKDITNYRRKLKTYFFNCNLKKTLPKLPKINEHFVDNQGQYLWIIKPTFLNRGRGIKVFSKLQALYKYIEQNIAGYVEQPLIKDKNDDQNKQIKIDYIKRNSQCIKQSLLYRDPSNRQAKQKKETSEFFDGNQYIRIQPRVPSIIKTDKFLIQKYLQKPLLIMNRKFDIRIWVLVTHQLKCYVFKQGYIRLSSMQYSVKDDQDNTFRHLTNNAVQKYSEQYGSICQGNQLPFSSLKDKMNQSGLDFDKTIDKIHSQITLTLKATWKSLNPSNRKFQFQVFGYDFMIDQSGNSWLIQVNNNPCIQQSSTILKHYLPRMLNDAFKLTLDQLFWGSVSNAKFPVAGYKDQESMWKKLNVEEK